MFELLPESTENTIGFKVSGKVVAEDYDLLLPRLDEAIAAHGKINLLVLMEDFGGWEGLDAAKADFRLGTMQYRQVERAAFVGDPFHIGIPIAYLVLSEYEVKDLTVLIEAKATGIPVRTFAPLMVSQSAYMVA